MSEDKDKWDDLWKNPEEMLYYTDVFRLMDEIKLEYLLAILPPNKQNTKIVEVGCGPAWLSCALASEGYNTTCLDYSENALNIARKNYEMQGNKGEFIVGDALNMAFEDNSFDVVLSTGLLEHFEDPSVVINEMVRILKPGGIFYSDIVPKKFALFRAHIDFVIGLNNLIKKEEDEIYEKKLNSNDIENILISSKLEDINVIPAGVFLPQIPYGRRIPTLKKIEYNFLSKIKRLFTVWDNTKIAEWCGFYYFCYAKKPSNEKNIH